jgi:hypothetical protein
LLDGDRETGVRVEIRAGGPVIGFRQRSEEMYRDPSILLGFVGTDKAVQRSASRFRQLACHPSTRHPSTRRSGRRAGQVATE